MAYDGILISEMGIKKWLEGRSNNAFSNINMLQSQASMNTRWQECNFGCHGPSYRVSRRELSYSEAISQLQDVSPFAAGVVDGLQFQTFRQVEVVAQGVNRTSEGLGVSGHEQISVVGAENYAAYNFIKVNVCRLVNLDFESFENPLSQIVFYIVNEYISFVPEDAILSMVKSGALVVDLDPSDVLSAINEGLVAGLSSVDLEEAKSFFASRGERFVGKQVGRKLAKPISVMIAAKISKRVMLSAKNNIAFKRRISRLKASFRPVNGHLGSALLMLLKANGWLGISATASRELRQDCPRLWSYSRNNLGGFDMIYFLISDFVTEYVDRLSVLEHQPDVFASAMLSLMKAGKTREIFFPS